MPKQKLGCDFSDCITQNPPRDTRGMLLISPLDENSSPKDSRYFVYEYLKAASLLVDTKQTRYNDGLVYPVLNLYINAVEFALKMLITELVNHREKSCCSLINPPPLNYEESLTKHKLSPLIDICKSMIPTDGTLHVLPDFDDFASFIKLCENYGLDCMSTRYERDRNFKPYLLQLHQSWVNLEKFNKRISKICWGILDYGYGDHFGLCALDEFSERRLNELCLAKKIMYQKKSFFEKVREKRADDSEEMDVEIALEYLFGLGNEVSHAINDLNDSEIAALTMGLYFNCLPIRVGNLKSFKKNLRDNNIRKIGERAQMFEESLRILEIHIDFVGKVRSEKN